MQGNSRYTYHAPRNIYILGTRNWLSLFWRGWVGTYRDRPYCIDSRDGAFQSGHGRIPYNAKPLPVYLPSALSFLAGGLNSNVSIKSDTIFSSLSLLCGWLDGSHKSVLDLLHREHWVAVNVPQFPHERSTGLSSICLILFGGGGHGMITGKGKHIGVKLIMGESTVKPSNLACLPSLVNIAP